VAQAAKYCKRGHPRTPENVRSPRVCRLCERERYDSAEYREWNRERRWRDEDYRTAENRRHLDRYYSEDPQTHFLILQGRVQRDLRLRAERIEARHGSL